MGALAARPAAGHAERVARRLARPPGGAPRRPPRRAVCIMALDPSHAGGGGGGGGGDDDEGPHGGALESAPSLPLSAAGSVASSLGSWPSSMGAGGLGGLRNGSSSSSSSGSGDSASSSNSFLRGTGGGAADAHAAAAAAAWPGPKPLLALARWAARPDARPTLGVGYQQHGLLGVAQLDSFGDVIPPKALSAKRDGAVGWIRREGERGAAARGAARAGPWRRRRCGRAKGGRTREREGMPGGRVHAARTLYGVMRLPRWRAHSPRHLLPEQRGRQRRREAPRHRAPPDGGGRGDGGRLGLPMRRAGAAPPAAAALAPPRACRPAPACRPAAGAAARRRVPGRGVSARGGRTVSLSVSDAVVPTGRPSCCAFRDGQPCTHLTLSPRLAPTHPRPNPTHPAPPRQHCDAANTAAWRLYRDLGYRRVALEAPWAPYVNGRPPNRCWLLVKRLPTAAVEAAREAREREEAARREGEEGRGGERRASSWLAAAAAESRPLAARLVPAPGAGRSALAP
jgi:hypothetical protein